MRNKSNWNQIRGLWCLTPLSTIFQLYIVAVSFMGGVNWRKQPTMSKVTDKLSHIMLYQVHRAWVRFEPTTLVVIGTDCIGSYKWQYKKDWPTTNRIITWFHIYYITHWKGGKIFFKCLRFFLSITVSHRLTPMGKYIYTVVPLFYKATPTKSHTSFMSCRARFHMHLDSKILLSCPLKRDHSL
jgi:hypothetical protein